MNYIDERTIKIANYIIDTKCTVRQAGKIFGVSKSTIHKDLTERLPKLNKSLFVDIRKVLDLNLAERHIRGGQATKKKYKKQSIC